MSSNRLPDPAPDAGLGQPPAEFGLIARHFRPLAGLGSLGLLDDAALLDPPPGRSLVLTADAMVAGVHFLPDDPADLVGRKLLRVNLSDLAAMGAVPLAYLMTVSAPRETPDAWFAAFASGLAQDQAAFGITLLGGDTTHTPGPLSLSLTCIGHVAPGGAVQRSGAQAGDEVWVTGTIGDGALGLLAAQGRLADPAGALADRYRLPRPRLGLLEPGLVAAAMDVSDGLVQDLGHLARAAGLAAVVEAEQVPRSCSGSMWLKTCLTGGDDYELLMAVRPRQAEALKARAQAIGIPVTRIGQFNPGSGVRVLTAGGAEIRLERAGWSHF
jgi:thiamine-monophosphate kinase